MYIYHLKKRKHAQTPLPYLVLFQSAVAVYVHLGEQVFFYTRQVRARDAIAQGHVGHGGGRHRQLLELLLSPRSQTTFATEWARGISSHDMHAGAVRQQTDSNKKELECVHNNELFSNLKRQNHHAGADCEYALNQCRSSKK